ncbi:hypothetical protein, partial [Rhizobium giardinii]|uniref:hypothetical protein n=1 Tax=Rhizobium giardinii TaxID=56731 RepID=UPI0016077835
MHQNAEWAAWKPPIAMPARNRSVAVVVGRSATATRAIPVTRARAAQFPHFLAALALGAATIPVTRARAAQFPHFLAALALGAATIPVTRARA